MDKHFNLFFSYGRGSRKNLDSRKQLEDNLTRALMITIKGLSENNRLEILGQLIGLKIKGPTTLDLQNFDDENLRLVKKIKNKVILTIQRSECKLQREHLKRLDLSGLDDLSQARRKTALKDINRLLKLSEGETVQTHLINGIEVPSTDLSSIGQMLTGNRPDAWIRSQNTAILIESKVGWNQVSKYQLYRHINGKHGLQVSAADIADAKGYKMIHLTWAQISQELSNIAGSPKENFLIKSFQEYLSLTGETMDLKYLTTGQPIDHDIHKDQFVLLLQKLEEKLSATDLDIHRKKRPLDSLWEVFGREQGNKIKKDPHYSIYFWQDLTGLALSTKGSNRTKFRRMLDTDEFRSFINHVITNTEPKLLSRWYVKYVDYRLIDHVKGQIRGDKMTPMVIDIKFTKLANPDMRAAFIDMLKNPQIVKSAKQVEIGFQIRYPDEDKIKDNDSVQLRKENKKLLDDPEKLIEQYVEFMQLTRPIFDFLNR